MSLANRGCSTIGDPNDIRLVGGAWVREGRPEDSDACAAIDGDRVPEMAWLPRVHAPEEVRRFYRERLFAVCRVTVAELGGWVAGYIVVNGEGVVAALYVAAEARGAGVGAASVRAAQAARLEGLTLWTFAANVGARRFYGRLRFEEAGGTAGENDEGLPDVMLTWRAFA